MTKADIIEILSKEADIPRNHSGIIVESVFKSIKEALFKGEKVEIRGFGSFKMKTRHPHTARNPKTGENVKVGERQVPYFRPGKELKLAINAKG